MGLILGSDFINLVRAYRVVWIGGRYGGGKTALAYRLAYELLKSGEYRYLLSNCSSVWRDSPDDVVMRQNRYIDCVILLDEGGLFLKTGQDVDEFMAFMRKGNTCLILPSVTPPPFKTKMLKVQRVFNFGVVGIPAWVYKWHLTSGDTRESNIFIWSKPYEIFGIYDTDEAPLDDAGISAFLRQHKETIGKRTAGAWKSASGAPSTGVTISEVDSSGGGG